MTDPVNLTFASELALKSCRVTFVLSLLKPVLKRERKKEWKLNIDDPDDPLFIQALLWGSANECILSNCCGFFTD